MANSKKTTFKAEWLTNPQFKFLESVPGNPNAAYCKLCFKRIDLSNMGRRAVTSHVEGKKHSSKIQEAQTSNLLQSIPKAPHQVGNFLEIT